MLWWALTKGYGSGTLRKHSRSIVRITAERSIPEFMLIPIYVFIYLFVCLSVYLAIFLPIHPSSSIYLQAWKWNFSARLPQFWKLATSKRQQFCETSSIFEVDNIKKCSNSARLPSKLESWVQSWRPCTKSYKYVQIHFAIFQSMFLKYCACHEKVRPGQTKSCTCHTKYHKIIFPKLKIWCSKMQHSQEISARTC